MGRQAIDTIIIGAGLTGLVAAYKLIEKGSNVLLLEAQERIGGRIHTVGISNNQPIELGATWLGKKHQNLFNLLSDLGLEVFPQKFGDKAIFEPISTSPPYMASLQENPDPSFRVQGGTESIIHQLVAKIGKEQIRCSEQVKVVKASSDYIEVQTTTASYRGQKVISTIPPNLLVNSVEFLPKLPPKTVSIAESTHTWMADSLKVALSYESPFWNNTSGTVLSNVGPIPEMYEHNNWGDNFYALMGFLNGNYFSLTKEERLSLVLKQLTKYYGSEVENYLNYHEKVWRHEAFTFQPYKSHVLPHQNNGNPIFQSSYFDGRLIIAGSETSPVFPGYMEGAVYSGTFAAGLVYA